MVGDSLGFQWVTEKDSNIVPKRRNYEFIDAVDEHIRIKGALFEANGCQLFEKDCMSSIFASPSKLG